MSSTPDITSHSEGRSQVGTARLQRLSDWCSKDNAAAAELELMAWSHDPGCPDEALLLLAALQARSGMAHHAASLLKRVDPAHAVAVDTLQLLAALMITQEWKESARQATRTLFNEHGYQAGVLRWIQLMQMPGCENLSGTPTASAEHLAVELLDDPSVIPSIVSGLRHKPHIQHIRRMRDALQRLERDITDPQLQVMLYAAAAELALLDESPDDARRWAMRGLNADPYNATLALLLNRASDAMAQPELPAESGHALKALHAAAERHPDYPDVRAALIRREFAAGDRQAARQRLNDWLKQQPDSPLAAELRREQAA